MISRFSFCTLITKPHLNKSLGSQKLWKLIMNLWMLVIYCTDLITLFWYLKYKPVTESLYSLERMDLFPSLLLKGVGDRRTVWRAVSCAVPSPSSHPSCSSLLKHRSLGGFQFLNQDIPTFHCLSLSALSCLRPDLLFSFILLNVSFCTNLSLKCVTYSFLYVIVVLLGCSSFLFSPRYIQSYLPLTSPPSSFD